MPTTRRSFLTRSATLAALAPVGQIARAAEAPASTPDMVLETSEKEMVFDGTLCRVRTYNGMLPGPAIHARPGDRKVIRLKNSLPRSSSAGWNGDHNVPHNLGGTNLHFHGLDVEPHLFWPLGTQDPLAKMISIEPGGSLDYPLHIPIDHPPGLYWYHPHKHGSTAVQAVSGMAGPIVIKGEIDEVPEIKAAKDIPLVIQDLGMFPDHHSAAGVSTAQQAPTHSYQPKQNAIWQTFQQDQVTVYDPATGKNVPQSPGTQGFTTGDYPRRFFLLNGKPFFVETHNSANAACPVDAQGKAPKQCPVPKQLPVQRIELGRGGAFSDAQRLFGQHDAARGRRSCGASAGDGWAKFPRGADDRHGSGAAAAAWSGQPRRIHDSGRQTGYLPDQATVPEPAVSL